MVHTPVDKRKFRRLDGAPSHLSRSDKDSPQILGCLQRTAKRMENGVREGHERLDELLAG